MDRCVLPNQEGLEDRHRLPVGGAGGRRRDQKGHALRGIKLGIRGQASFFAYFFFASLILVAALVLRCSVLDWCFLVASVGTVLTVELLYSGLLTILQNLLVPAQETHRAARDMAAGAVLIARSAAGLVVVLVFWQRLVGFLMSGSP
jgi:diacylglycerol kinase